MKYHFTRQQWVTPLKRYSSNNSSSRRTHPSSSWLGESSAAATRYISYGREGAMRWVCNNVSGRWGEGWRNSKEEMMSCQKEKKNAPSCGNWKSLEVDDGVVHPAHSWGVFTEDISWSPVGRIRVEQSRTSYWRNAPHQRRSAHPSAAAWGAPVTKLRIIENEERLKGRKSRESFPWTCESQNTKKSWLTILSAWITMTLPYIYNNADRVY